MAEINDLKVFLNERDEMKAPEMAERGRWVLGGMEPIDVWSIFAFFLKEVGEDEELQKTVNRYIAWIDDVNYPSGKINELLE